MKVLKQLEQEQIKMGLPSFKSGDTVRVHVSIREGDKKRIQIFEGLVIRKRKAGLGSTFTVRKISYGIGVERIFPLYSPVVDNIEVVQKGRVRRSRLYYMRQLKGKAARQKIKRLA